MPLSLSPPALAAAWLIALGYIGLTSVAAWLLIDCLKIRLSRLEQICLGIIGGILGSSWLTLISWRIFGQNIGTGLVVASCLAIILWRHHRVQSTFSQLQSEIRHHKLKLPSLIQTIFWIILLILFAWLSWTHFLPQSQRGWASAGNTWADLALHMTLASWFIVHGTSHLILPVFPSVQLTYPFLVDLHSAQIYWLTGSWAIAFGLPSFMLISSAFYLIYRLGQRLAGSRLVGAIWVILVLFSGSASSALPLVSDIASQNYTNYYDYSNLATTKPESLDNFANFTTSHLLPQRSYLLGFAVVLGCLILLKALLDNKNSSRRQWLGVGLIVGLLPLAHVHSYFVIMGSLTLLALWLAGHFDIRTKSVGWALLMAGLIGLPQIFWQFLNSFHSGFAHWRFGWLTPQGGNPLHFWILNLGIWLVIVPFAVWKWQKSKHNQILSTILLITGGLIFVACNLVIFQPNEWDNMKFLTYAYVFFSLPVAWLIASWFNQKRWMQFGAGIVLIVITLTGLQSIYLESTRSYVIYSNSDQSMAEYVVNHTPANAVILTNTRHNNPIPTLTGRQIVMGYPGWLASYGIDFQAVEADSLAMWEPSQNATKLLKQYNVSYLAINQVDATNMGLDLAKLQQNYTEVFNNSDWFIYKLNFPN